MRTPVNDEHVEEPLYSMDELRVHLFAFRRTNVDLNTGAFINRPTTPHELLTRLRTHFRILNVDRLPTVIRELLYRETDDGFIHINGMIILEHERTNTLLRLIIATSTM